MNSSTQEQSDTAAGIVQLFNMLDFELSKQLSSLKNLRTV